MAYVNTTRVEVSSNGLRGRLAALWADFAARRASAKLYRQTVEELSALSNRDLADLGLNRSDINTIAHEAAYGK